MSEEFFQDPTVTDLIENNIQQVEGLEDKQAKKMLKAFRNVRQKLQDRLLTIPEGTFTEQQMNVTLIQVDAAIEAIKKRLKGELATSSDILAVTGVEHLAKEISRFSKKFEGSVQPLNLNMIAIATDSKKFLINKHEASIDAYGTGLRAQITQNITTSMIMRDNTTRTVSALVSDVGRFFMGEEWKLERIARTELHGMYNYSKLNGLAKVQEDTLPDLQKALMHPMDRRTGADSVELSRENPIVDIDKPFVFTWKGKERVFMMPPDRPNDRAILVPYRAEWGSQATKFASR